MTHGARKKSEIIDHVHGLRWGSTVMMAWDTADGSPVPVRVLRSPVDSAEGPDDADILRLRQTVVGEGAITELRDDDTLESAEWYVYTLFAKDPEGAWHEQHVVRLKSATEWHWSRDEESGPGPSFERLTEMKRDLPAS
jgi:hypothetical protein